MLQITVPASSDRELWDSKNQEFIYVKGCKEQTLILEHSLVSISKWESKWNKPFLGRIPKTTEETTDYVRCMNLTQNVPDEVYGRLSDENFRTINEYIKSPMTGTTFKDEKRKSQSRSEVTSEIIYYWMISLGIPFECQEWHLNRLLTLIRVCDIKNRPAKKRSTSEIMRNNSALNAARRRKYNTKG